MICNLFSNFPCGRNPRGDVLRGALYKPLPLSSTPYRKKALRNCDPPLQEPACWQWRPDSRCRTYRPHRQQAGSYKGIAQIPTQAITISSSTTEAVTLVPGRNCPD